MDSQRQTHAPQGDFIPGEPFHTGVGNFFQLWAQIQRKGVCLHKGKPGGFAFPRACGKIGNVLDPRDKDTKLRPPFFDGGGGTRARERKKELHSSVYRCRGRAVDWGAVPSSPPPGFELHAVTTNIFLRPAWPHRKGPAGWRGLSCLSAGVIAAGLAPWPRQWHD